MDWSSGVHHVTFDQVMEMAKGQLITVQCETTEEDEQKKVAAKKQAAWLYWWGEGYNDRYFGRVTGQDLLDIAQENELYNRAYRCGYLTAMEDAREMKALQEES